MYGRCLIWPRQRWKELGPSTFVPLYGAQRLNGELTQTAVVKSERLLWRSFCDEFGCDSGRKVVVEQALGLWQLMLYSVVGRGASGTPRMEEEALDCRRRLRRRDQATVGRCDVGGCSWMETRSSGLIAHQMALRQLSFNQRGPLRTLIRIIYV